MNYSEFVAGLIKPGADILATLTPEKCNLLHMAVGLSGEVAELFDAMDPAHIVEEIGDCEFFLEGLKMVLPGAGEPIESGSIIVIAGDILDRVKKHTVYNKPLDEQQLRRLIATFDKELEGIYAETGISRDKVLQANMEKLKLRYKAGYSDKAAQERADK